MGKGLCFILFLFLYAKFSLAAPCYGTTMPDKNKWFSGFEIFSLTEQELGQDYGDIGSNQGFFLLSYGVFDWLSFDLKAGLGNIKQKSLNQDQQTYDTAFAGGYGLRARVYEDKDTKAVLGFQHISTHPKKIHIEDQKNTAILDDWQFSALISKNISRVSIYAGLRWDRIDYIHWVGEDRKRKMSDTSDCLGPVLGLDFFLTDNIFFNIESQFVNARSLALSIKHKF